MSRLQVSSDLILTIMAVSLPVHVGLAAPVAQWHFDEDPGTTVAADSIGGVHGNLAGDADFVSGGISGNAVSMTRAGNGLVNMGDHFGFTGTDFSVVAWARTAPGDQTPDYFVVAKHRSTFFVGYMLGINANGAYGQTDKAWFYDSNPSPGDDPRSTTTVNDGEWHQIVGVYHAGGLAEIYVDGAGVEDSKPGDVIGGSNAPFLVGGIDVGGTPSAVFNGLVDEVQLYDHALTSDDVQYLFENPSKVIPEPAPSLLLLMGWLVLGRQRRVSAPHSSRGL